MIQKRYIKNCFSHLKKICKHKYWVGYYCFNTGLYWRGIKHDFSKFSPVEFFESVKYYQGSRSPIDACKEENGWSKAWQHHKGRNDHHYQYWVDDHDNGGKPLIMPFECAAELVCDYLGAARAYQGYKFSYNGEYQWWSEKKKQPLLMHPAIKDFIEKCLYDLMLCEKHLNVKLKTVDIIWFNKDYLFVQYHRAVKKYE